MISAGLAAGVPWITPAPQLLTAAAGVEDWPDLIRTGGTGAVILLLIYALKLLVSGVIRLDREVKVAETRAVAAETRAVVAEEKLDRLRESFMSDLSPALLRNSVTGEKLVESVTRITEQNERLIGAFLRRLGE